MKKNKAKFAKRVDPEIEREFIEQSGALVKDEPLKPSEKSFIENLHIRGHAYFDEQGYSAEEEAAFLARPNVRREIERLQSIMEDGQSFIERQKFMARVKLGAMLPAAMNIVAKTLRGLKDKDGAIVNPEDVPTRAQYDAAMDIMDRCGIAPDEINVNFLVAAPVNRHVRKTDDAKYDSVAVVQRDRVRTAIDKVIKMYGDSESTLSELHEARTFTKKRKKFRKKLKNRERREEDETKGPLNED